MQSWKRLGLVFKPSGKYWWSRSHAAVPTVAKIYNDYIRVVYNTRDENNRTRPSFIDIVIDGEKFYVKNVYDRFILDLGRPGLFDDSGIWIQSIVNGNDKTLFYYNGWHRGVTVPYYTFVGLAIGQVDDMKLQKISKAPILPRNAIDPYGTSGPWVLREKSMWRLYYISIVDFRLLEGKGMYYYHIKYAESKDGLHWNRKGKIAIDFKYPGETRIARPNVIKQDNKYRMWYCYAIGHGGYKIGYAESEDGINWTRLDDKIKFEGEPQDWEKEMMAYPNVFELDNELYMLYNGNGYGRTGFGLAKLV